MIFPPPYTAVHAAEPSTALYDSAVFALAFGLVEFCHLFLPSPFSVPFKINKPVMLHRKYSFSLLHVHIVQYLQYLSRSFHLPCRFYKAEKIAHELDQKKVVRTSFPDTSDRFYTVKGLLKIVIILNLPISSLLRDEPLN